MNRPNETASDAGQPADQVHDTVHDHVEGKLPFIEVYCATPIETCEARDPKGLYKKARAALAAGKGMGFTGVDDPYEAPTNPEIRLDMAKQTVEEGVKVVLDYLVAHGYLGGR